MTPSPFAQPIEYYQRLPTSQYQYSSQHLHDWLYFNLLLYTHITDCLRSMLTCWSLLPILTVTQATANIGSLYLTVPDASGVMAGQSVSGPGIQPGTLVILVDHTQTPPPVQISNPTTAALAATSVTFTQQAIGRQLDTLGKILGQDRKVNFQPVSGSAILGDDDYRLLLQCTIMKNHWNGQNWSLQPLWKVIFPGGSIIINDGQDMTAAISVKGSLTNLQRELIAHGYIVPRPEGVLYTYDVPILPTFGFDLNNSDQAGFDLGRFA